MEEIIELTFESPEGIIDCRLEPERNDDDGVFYNATILYPNTVNGFSRSEIYCHRLFRDAKTGCYSFEAGDVPVLPKIEALESQIATAIAQAVRGR